MQCSKIIKPNSFEIGEVIHEIVKENKEHLLLFKDCKQHEKHKKI